ncbi:hypothetical protein I79_001587 [Cricetulus griseus]|uniref:Uncharacterized protein n=1 Tax=Cricetulus griseus TaxID=10029 RepID=G3GV56_CRIGR|nr:hypothetical protein I79_001587 [Cricetulus griseus]
MDIPQFSPIGDGSKAICFQLFSLLIQVILQLASVYVMYWGTDARKWDCWANRMKVIATSCIWENILEYTKITRIENNEP